MDFEYSAKVKELINRVTSFMEEHVYPNEEEMHKQVSLDPWSTPPLLEALKTKAKAEGLWNLFLPFAYGEYSAGLTNLEYAPLAEIMGKVMWAPEVFNCAAPDTGNMEVLAKYGNEEQKKRWLPKICSGETIGALAMTEPSGGSDLAGIKTTAKDMGDHYLVNGSKTFITNGLLSDFVITAVKTDSKKNAKGISLLVLERGMEGFERGKKLEKIGQKAQDTAELFFKDVKVPKENILGVEGMGFIYLMQELPQERLSVALSAIAGAESILEQTIAYVKERKAFGRSISTFQNTQFKLAEMSAELTMARVFVDKCLELLVEKQLDVVTAAKLKLLTTDMQCKVIDECLQLHGGYGYMLEYPVARAYADARVQKIYAGTNEIMKLIIGRSLV